MADDETERNPSKPELEVRLEQSRVPTYSELYVETFLDEGGYKFRANPRNQWARIASATRTAVTVYPRSTNAYAQTYLAPKMGKIKSIEFSIPGRKDLLTTVDDYRQAFVFMPAGMIDEPTWGFGLVKELRVVWQLLSTIDNIDAILLVEGSGISASGHTLHIGRNLFNQARRDVESIWNRYKSEANEDKTIAVHNRLLSGLDPIRFPQVAKKQRPGKVFETIKLAERAPAQRKDVAAAVGYVRAHVNSVASDPKSELLELRAEIERVTVIELEKMFGEKLDKKLSESSWQEFFKANAFVLTLLFSHPAFLIQEQAYVGGQGINRRGAKIADFLVANGLAGSLAIVEIKRPDTEILLSSPYRGNDIFSPSTELTGAVCQVLAQKYDITKNIASLKEDSETLRDRTAEALKCIVLAGRAPTDPKRRRAFNLFRNACKDVEIITFDELHQKLRQLCALLKGEVFNTPSTAIEVDPDDIPF